jgi:hypothetical protein
MYMSDGRIHWVPWPGHHLVDKATCSICSMIMAFSLKQIMNMLDCSKHACPCNSCWVQAPSAKKGIVPALLVGSSTTPITAAHAAMCAQQVRNGTTSAVPLNLLLM